MVARIRVTNPVQSGLQNLKLNAVCRALSACDSLVRIPFRLHYSRMSWAPPSTV